MGKLELLIRIIGDTRLGKLGGFVGCGIGGIFFGELLRLHLSREDWILINMHRLWDVRGCLNIKHQLGVRKANLLKLDSHVPPTLKNETVNRCRVCIFICGGMGYARPP
jgi:hypothetical protein